MGRSHTASAFPLLVFSYARVTTFGSSSFSCVIFPQYRLVTIWYRSFLDIAWSGITSCSVFASSIFLSLLLFHSPFLPRLSVPSHHNMSRYLSVNSYGSGSGSGSRDRSRSRSRTPSSSRREETRHEVRRNVLPEVRVLDQSRADPFTTSLLTPQSRTFRLAVFVMHFAISMLESRSGRAALIHTAERVWSNWTRRQRRNTIYSNERPPMEQLVDRFLENIREDPPNIIVSTRVRGEGLVERLAWADEREQYEVKWGALYRLNKTVSRPCSRCSWCHNSILRDSILI